MADFEINKRLKHLIYDVYKMSALAFSSRYDDNNGVKTSQVLRERNGLSIQMLEQIIKAYPEINRTWLLTGEGEMLNPTEPQVPDMPGMQESFTGEAIWRIGYEEIKKLIDAKEIHTNKYVSTIEELNTSLKKENERLRDEADQLNARIIQLEELIQKTGRQHTPINHE